MYFLQPSQKRLLSSLTPLFVIAIVFGLMLLRTAWKPILPSSLQSWDVLLPFVVFFGQRRSIPEGLILALFTSHLYSLLSAAPIGVFTTHYLILFFVARAVAYSLYASNSVSIVLLLIVLGFVSRLVLPWVASLFGHSWPVLSFANFPLMGMLATAFFGFILYALLVGLDRITSKTPEETIEFSGDGL